MNVKNITKRLVTLRYRSSRWKKRIGDRVASPRRTERQLYFHLNVGAGKDRIRILVATETLSLQ
ncbi:hypothetical protein RMSM_04653 [Rhodopirellula maiorica SM1]|uniref:Uncharacterized protein n=1 Tax=Rhodopirellula maiorica SM1 TaxID=1265738 RepID=M5RWU8_9BACT|nr:hypothetical protein RMSM_04653 [Rhodopirellula maiorica SM1]